MEWYKIILGVAIWLIGLWIWTKVSDFHKNKYHNDSWKGRKKNI